MLHRRIAFADVGFFVATFVVVVAAVAVVAFLAVVVAVTGVHARVAR